MTHKTPIDPRVVVGALLAVGVGAIMASLPRDGLLAHTAADDALYYLAIARRAGQAHWPTFDGVHTTTGFHPLWLFVLVPLAKMLGSPWALLRVTIALSSALMLAASLSFGRLFGRAWGSDAGVIGAVLLVASPGIARLGWMAMEASLALLLISFFLRELFGGRLRANRLGVLAGLAILARLDMAIVVAVALAWTIVISRKISWRSAIATGLIASLTVLPYVAWNVALTGHAMTISSATKAYVAEDNAMRAHGGRINFGFAIDVGHEVARTAKEIARLSPASALAGPVALAGLDHPSAVDLPHHRVALVLFVFVAIAIGGGLAARFSSPRSEPNGPLASADLLMVLLIASALHCAMACVLLVGQSGPWYWGLEAFTIAAAIAYASARWRAANKVALVASGATIVSMAMLGAALVAGRLAGRLDARPSFASVILKAGDALEARREPGDVAGSCNAGMLGFFDPGVVNLDGLVNDWSLLEARRHRDMRGYLARENVRWVADCVPAAAMDQYAQQLGLTRHDVDVQVEIPGPTCVGFVWRIAEPASTASR